MNTTHVTKILLDAAMTALFCSLLFAFETGLTYHEIAGIAIFFMFCLHISLNWKWVRKVTATFFRPATKRKPKWMYLLNWMLFAGICLITVTGILISQVVFPTISRNSAVLVSVHRLAAYCCAGLFSTHIALHAKYLVASVKRIVANFREPAVRRAITGFLAVGAIAAVVYFPMAAGFNSRFYAISDLSRANTVQLEDNPSATTEKDTHDTTKEGDEDESGNAALQQTQDTSDTVSLSDFLGGMFCTGCHKHCSLLSPQCGKGERQAEAATAEYQEQYANTALAN